MKWNENECVIICNVLRYDASQFVEAQVVELVPSQGEVLARWERALRERGGVYRKTAGMHARLALADGTVKTVVGGASEVPTRAMMWWRIIRAGRPHH